MRTFRPIVSVMLVICVVVCGVVNQPVVVAQDKATLAKRVEAIFKQHCYRCHGEGGKAESEFYVLNRESLVSPKRVRVGKPDESPLLRKVRSGDMPQDDEPLKKEDQETIRQWIEAGAPDFAAARPERKFISPADTLTSIAADLSKIEKTSRDDLLFVRYFTITHLYNAGLDDDQLATYRNALSKLINSLSWGRRVRPPRAVDAQQTLFAIDLRDYKWNEKIWEAIADTNPYGVKYDSTAAKYSYKTTGTDLPVVRGDWFVAAASRPPLYHKVLQLPDTDIALEKLLQVDIDENLRTKRVARAGFNGSGVSQNNRLIERHESDLTNGAYWKSYDFAGNDGVKNLFAHPLGPKGTNAFVPDGGEIIFNLPNGLQAYLLVDAKGKRIDKGPTNVVSDPVQKDRAVVNGLSCMSCHVAGMIFKQDEVREHVENNRASFAAREVETVLSLYPTAGTFDALQKEDAARFAEAVKKTGAPVAKQDPIVQLALRFEAELGVKLAAAEVGLPVEDFLNGLDRSPALSRTLGSLKVPGRTIKREVFVSTFGSIVKDLGLGTFLARAASSAGLSSVPATDPKSFTNSTGMTMLRIDAGEFQQGSPVSEADRNEDEGPQHRVRITKPFFMAKHEVTQGQFENVLARNPSYLSRTGGGKNQIAGLDAGRLPVESVSWFDCVEFCNALSAKENLSPCYRLTNIQRKDGSISFADVSLLNGTGYRLPTEAEWEYACRAGTTTPFHFGGANNGREANINGDFPYGTTTKGPALERTTTVGSYPPNAFGLHDMHGNVWEWCQDYYDAKYYAQRVETDPQGPSSGTLRVLRGGSWGGHPWYSRSANRNGNTPDDRSFNLGFRVVCE